MSADESKPAKIRGTFVREDGRYGVVECANVPEHLRVHFLLRRQLGGALVGDAVVLEYQVTPSSGLWNVIAVQAKAVPGRYTVQITAKVWANNRRNAYAQVERALSAARDGIEYIDAEDVRIEPYCVHTDAGLYYEDARDLAVDGSALCAICQKAEPLTQGLIYDVTALQDAVIGWTASQPAGYRYHLPGYFDDDGRYLGADRNGIEPLFEVPQRETGDKPNKE